MVGEMDGKLYDASALSKAIGDTPRQVRAVSVVADVTPTTVRRAMEGRDGISVRNLVAIIEASGASYAKVFNPRYYERSREQETN